jgi:hypothetical protein
MTGMVSISNVFFSCPNSVWLTNTLPEHAEYRDGLNTDLSKEYEDIFIHLDEWEGVEEDDLSLNSIRDPISVPDFAAEFERKLDSKPVLAADVRQFLGLRFDVRYSFDLSILFPILMTSVGEYRPRIYHT